MDERGHRIIEIVNQFSSLIRIVIQKNIFPSDGIDLEDIEQEVKLKIWKLLKKGKKVEKLPSYIKKIAFTAAIDELRKMRKQTNSFEARALKQINPSSMNEIADQTHIKPEDFFEKKELKQSVLDAIETLSENRKQVIRLYLYGVTIDEIGELFSWDKTKVRHLLYRGIDDLKLKLRPGRQKEKLKKN